MAFKVVLQAGHQNTLNGQTGAPGEMANNIRIRDRLGQILIEKGFVITLVDANYKNFSEDFNLALALHCDADIYGTGGGFVDFPDPAVDSVNSESKRIKEAIESMYFDHSGIVSHPERSNGNTKFYYWWSNLTAKTPCVIIEMGVAQDAHDKVILADTDRVANAIARGICKAFNVQFDPLPAPQPPQPPATNPSEVDTLKAQIKTLQGNIEGLTKERDDYKKTAEACGQQIINLQKLCDDKDKIINTKNALIATIKTVVYGKGWSWTKVDRVKTELTKANV